MAISTIEAHIDEMDKARFSAFCSDVGIDTSSALNLFIKTVIRGESNSFHNFQRSGSILQCSQSGSCVEVYTGTQGGQGYTT